MVWEASDVEAALEAGEAEAEEAPAVGVMDAELVAGVLAPCLPVEFAGVDEFDPLVVLPALVGAPVDELELVETEPPVGQVVELGWMVTLSE